MIKLKNVSRLYPAKAEAGGGVIRALDNFSLNVDPGEWIAIMGPSGSGKSTFVNLIGCLDRPTSGEIWLDGKDVANISATELNRVRAEKIGFVFQQFHLIPYLTALENVMLAQYFHSMTDEQEALDALQRVGLKERAHHVPSQLSGGEQQRVCIARALINDPKIVLADEPTGNLDAANEEIVLRLLRELHQQGRTIVMVTHDPVVARLADRRIELHHGKIAVQEVFAMADEEQFDEVLEELWALAEHGKGILSLDVLGMLCGGSNSTASGGIPRFCATCWVIAAARRWRAAGSRSRASATMTSRSVPAVGSGAPNAATHPLRTPGTLPVMSSISCG